tara:strand:+ start:201 stop:362 length:162 start_codon:yes stop_codon:yes gene_type:complete
MKPFYRASQGIKNNLVFTKEKYKKFKQIKLYNDNISLLLKSVVLKGAINYEQL